MAECYLKPHTDHTASILGQSLVATARTLLWRDVLVAATPRIPDALARHCRTPRSRIWPAAYAAAYAAAHAAPLAATL